MTKKRILGCLRVPRVNTTGLDHVVDDWDAVSDTAEELSLLH
jgi:hypothetical protein